MSNTGEVVKGEYERLKTTEKQQSELIDLLSAIPKQQQRQDSTFMQIHDLMLVGNHLGLYDAVDLLVKAAHFQGNGR